MLEEARHDGCEDACEAFFKFLLQIKTKCNMLCVSIIAINSEDNIVYERLVPVRNALNSFIPTRRLCRTISALINWLIPVSFGARQNLNNKLWDLLLWLWTSWYIDVSSNSKTNTFRHYGLWSRSQTYRNWPLKMLCRQLGAINAYWYTLRSMMRLEENQAFFRFSFFWIKRRMIWISTELNEEI